MRPRLGLESCLALELITLNGKVEQIGLNNVNEVQQKPTILNDFRDAFEGLGCVEGKYTIKLKANSQPTIQPQRNVPLRLRDKLKATLDDLEKKDIITKVEEPVNWVSNLVIVIEKATWLDSGHRKGGFQTPKFWNYFKTLNGCKVFSVADMSNCYWHQKLTDESFWELLIHLLAGIGWK